MWSRLPHRHAVSEQPVLLKQNEDKIEGTVKVESFQPAEEGGAGGKMMRDARSFRKAQSSRQIFALHVAGTMPMGTLAST